MSFSSMNNWGKLKIELVPWAEQAFVLICQGLFKNVALAGSFAAIGKQVQDISREVEDGKQVRFQTRHGEHYTGSVGVMSIPPAH